MTLERREKTEGKGVDLVRDGMRKMKSATSSRDSSLETDHCFGYNNAGVTAETLE